MRSDDSPWPPFIFRPLKTNLARVYHTTSSLHNGGGRRPLGSSLKVKGRGFVTSRQPRKNQELFDFLEPTIDVEKGVILDQTNKGVV